MNVSGEIPLLTWHVGRTAFVALGLGELSNRCTDITGDRFQRRCEQVEDADVEVSIEAKNM